MSYPGDPPGGGYQPPPGAYLPPPGFPMAYPGPAFGQPVGTGPARVWRLLQVAILIGAIVWTAMAVFAVFSAVNGYQRVPMTAGGTITLSHSGGYVIYYEEHNGDADTMSVPNFRIRVTPASPGAAVTSLSKYQASVGYTLGSRAGQAAFTITISYPGRFRITISDYAGLPDSDLAVGGSIARNYVAMFVPPSLGVFSFAVFAMIRRRARRRITYG